MKKLCIALLTNATQHAPWRLHGITESRSCIYLPLPRSVRGYMLALDDGSVGIAVNDKIHTWERPLVVAHEIGHYIMHDRTLFLSYNAWPRAYEHREYESDVFAYMLAAHCSDMSVKDLYLFLNYLCGR